MFVFKQGISKEEKGTFWGALIGFIVIWIPICLMALAQNDRLDTTLFMLGLFFLVFTFPIILMGLSHMEWFHIYADRIECSSALGQKNVVHFCNVAYVEETKINLVTSGDPRTFYIFHDGRKSYDDKRIFSSQSCHNKWEYTLRIRKTPEMEDYILNTLHFEIRKTKTHWDNAKD